MKRLLSYRLLLVWALLGLVPASWLYASGSNDTLHVTDIIKNIRQKLASDQKFDNADSIKIYEALTLSKQINYTSGESQCFDILGIRERNRSNYNKALELHLKALNLLPETAYLRDRAIILNNIGVVYRRLDDLIHATEYHLQALKIAERINDIPNICVSLNSLGNIFMAQEKYADARKYFESALEKEKATRNLLGIAINYNNLGGTYKEEKQLDKAAGYYKKSLEANRMLGSRKGIAICYNDLGTIALEKNNLPEALEYFTKALDINRQIGDNRYVSDNYIDLGDVYLKKKELATALENYRQGLDIAQKIGAKQLVQTACEGISKTYQEMDNYALALEYYRKASAMKDSIKSETIAKYVEGMQIVYQSGKKDQEIKMLNYQQSVKDKKQKAVVAALVMGCLFLLVLAGLIYFSYRIKQKANQSLTQYNKDIEEKNSLLVNQKEEIQTQRDEIEFKSSQVKEAYELIKLKNESITDNIRYAVQIQNVMLPDISYIRSLLPNSFVYYEPKDIVSGDFYWLTQKDGQIIIAVADCTGHGVTGAFMSILGISALNEIVVEKNIVQTDQILNHLRRKIIWTLQQGDEFNESKEGIHMVVCAVDKTKNKLQFSGAINSFFLVRNHEVTQYKGDLMPISIYPDMSDFKSNTIDLQKDDMIYLYSDGYYGQFGGEDDKKFGLVQFRSLIQKIHNQSTEEQHNTIDTSLKGWKKGAEQVDDILVMGIRI